MCIIYRYLLYFIPNNMRVILATNALDGSKLVSFIASKNDTELTNQLDKILVSTTSKIPTEIAIEKLIKESSMTEKDDASLVFISNNISSYSVNVDSEEIFKNSYLLLLNGSCLQNFVSKAKVCEHANI